MPAFLEVADARVRYGNNEILKGVDLSVKKGSLWRCLAHRAAARPLCCVQLQVSTHQAMARSASVVKMSLAFHQTNAAWLWFSSPMRSGHT